MKLKTRPEVLTVFNSIIEEGLTPNQFYLLCCINESMSPPLINMHQELRHLVVNQWIKDNTSAEGPNYELTPKGYSIIAKVGSYMGVQVKAAMNTIMGDEFNKNCETYNNIFPRMKLPSNKAARAPIKEIVTAFKWFFENHDYDWETIHLAAATYIESEKSKNFKYTRTSKYFIRKQDTDKSWSSDLAAYCELVKNGEEYEEAKYTDKVF
jgi:hypothetical protein